MDIAKAHPELFHYTTAGGMEGILRNQTLWAAHAMFLNDTSEMTAFAQRLPGVLRPAIDVGIEPHLGIPANQKLLEQCGGKDGFVDSLVKETAGSLYTALLGSSVSAPYIEPYVLSFCTSDDPRITQHGLLSQWRGYGPDGGYALVFDTARLSVLIAEEAQRWTWATLMGGNVVYSLSSEDEIKEELGEQIDDIRNSITEFLRTAGNPDTLEPMYFALTQCACRYKHWGFAEEKEVRIVAIPANQEIIEETRRLKLPVSEKTRHTFLRNGTTVPCLHLLEDIASRNHNSLPITRILVGPHADKEKRQRAVQLLLKELELDIPVCVSEIPYVAHG
jgi:hypothetical protein